jgi:uncharacterized protein YjiS (DUF1127 family)
MSTQFPVLPIAGATLARVFVTLTTQVSRAVAAVALAWRNRGAARELSGLDQHMLADIGINRADLNDAFSGPFWEDPTALLRERALERRLNRPRLPSRQPRIVEPGFHRMPTNRSARLTV